MCVEKSPSCSGFGTRGISRPVVAGLKGPRRMEPRVSLLGMVTCGQTPTTSPWSKARRRLRFGENRKALARNARGFGLGWLIVTGEEAVRR